MTLGWKVLWPFLWFYLVIKNGLKTSKFRVKKSYDFTKKIKYCTAEVGPYKDGTMPKIYSYDLRTKVIESIELDGLKICQATKLFHINHNIIAVWLKWK